MSVGPIKSTQRPSTQIRTALGTGKPTNMTSGFGCHRTKKPLSRPMIPENATNSPDARRLLSKNLRSVQCHIFSISTTPNSRSSGNIRYIYRRLISQCTRVTTTTSASSHLVTADPLKRKDPVRCVSRREEHLVPIPCNEYRFFLHPYTPIQRTLLVHTSHLAPTYHTPKRFGYG